MFLIFPPLTPSSPFPSPPPAFPHTVVCVHWLCIYTYKFFGLFLPTPKLTFFLRFVSLTTNLYFLIPLPFSPIPPTRLSSGNQQNFSVSIKMFLFCLFILFVDSIVNRYVFIAIFLFIFFIFFFKKTLQHFI
uniref:Uncharacterized protein n=1 Tax=Molossus molossus TaxID=27622 RepID=A0A7J8FRZ1_MOLMO|nr:hypothetical protein HJG59_008314 [Molossus molossus]